MSAWSMWLSENRKIYMLSRRGNLTNPDSEKDQKQMNRSNCAYTVPYMTMYYS